MVREHHQFNGYEFEHTLRDSEDRGGWQGSVNRVAESQT